MEYLNEAELNEIGGGYFHQWPDFSSAQLVVECFGMR